MRDTINSDIANKVDYITDKDSVLLPIGEYVDLEHIYVHEDSTPGTANMFQDMANYESIVTEFRGVIHAIIEDGYSEFFNTHKEFTPETSSLVHEEFREIRSAVDDRVRQIYIEYDNKYGTDINFYKIWEEENEHIDFKFVEIYNRYVETEGVFKRFGNELSVKYRDLFGDYDDSVRTFKTKQEFDESVLLIDSLSKIGFEFRDSLISVYSEILPNESHRFKTIFQEKHDYSLSHYHVAVRNFRNHYQK